MNQQLDRPPTQPTEAATERDGNSAGRPAITQRIIVGIDETAQARAALRLAHRLAAGIGAEVVAVEAATTLSAEHTPQEAARYLAGIKDRLLGWLTPEFAAKTDIRVVEEEIDVALRHLSRQLAADYVVVGSAATEGSTEFGLGSLEHSLAHELTCPLVAVPAAANGDDAANENRTGNDVVVGIDGSDASRVALDLSSRLAAGLGGTAYAVFTIDDIYNTFTTHGYYGKDEQRARREAEQQDGPVEFVERIGHHPEDALIDVATERHAALLVVAARERGSMGGLLLGRVPDHLLHRPPCPVMVLPHAYTDAAERLAAR